MAFSFIRTLRTLSSERFLLQADGQPDSAVLELHFSSDDSVTATLLVLDDALTPDDRIRELLTFIDEALLPMASLNLKNLSFTVVHGKVLGQYENEIHT